MISWSRHCSGILHWAWSWCAGRQGRGTAGQAQSNVPRPWRPARHDRAKLQLANIYVQLGWTSRVCYSLFACWVADSHQPFNSEASRCIFKGISWIVIYFEIHSSNTQSLESVGIFEIHSGCILKGVSWISHSLRKLHFLADARRCFKDIIWVTFKSNSWSTKTFQIKLDPSEETSWIPLKIPLWSLLIYNSDAFGYTMQVTYKSTADLRDQFFDPAWVTFGNRGWSKRTFFEGWTWVTFLIQENPLKFTSRDPGESHLTKCSLKQAAWEGIIVCKWKNTKRIENPCNDPCLPVKQSTWLGSRSDFCYKRVILLRVICLKERFAFLKRTTTRWNFLKCCLQQARLTQRL